MKQYLIILGLLWSMMLASCSQVVDCKPDAMPFKASPSGIWGMYLRINKKIDVPFGENIIKTIGSGVATNLAGYIAVSGVASALKCVPFIGTIGGAVIMSAAQYALTLASGYVYLKALSFAAGRSSDGSITGDALSSAVNEVLQETGFLKSFIEQAKKDY